MCIISLMLNTCPDNCSVHYPPHSLKRVKPPPSFSPRGSRAAFLSFHSLPPPLQTLAYLMFSKVSKLWMLSKLSKLSKVLSCHGLSPPPLPVQTLAQLDHMALARRCSYGRSSTSWRCLRCCSVGWFNRYKTWFENPFEEICVHWAFISQPHPPDKLC